MQELRDVIVSSRRTTRSPDACGTAGQERHDGHRPCATRKVNEFCVEPGPVGR
jgi:hypothetical protein